jgi:hypothetical protein
MAEFNQGPVPIQFILYHLFEIPASYSGEGISLTTINREIDLVEEKLAEQCNSIRKQYPGLEFVARLSTGTDLKTGLENDVAEIDPYLVIIGTGGHYSELLSWDKEIISIIRELSVPVLVIPKHVTFSPVKKIAFSCNLKNANQFMPFHLIIRLVNFTGGQLYVLFVKSEGNEAEFSIAEEFVREKLAAINPVYHSVKEKNIVDAVSRYVKENAIDVLMVTPRMHGIWESLVYKDHAKELVRLNSIPVLALRQYNK